MEKTDTEYQYKLLKVAAAAVAGADQLFAGVAGPLAETGSQAGQAVPEEQEQLGRAVLRLGKAAVAVLVHQMVGAAPHLTEPGGDVPQACLQVQGEQVGMLVAVLPPAFQIVHPQLPQSGQRHVLPVGIVDGIFLFILLFQLLFHGVSPKGYKIVTKCIIPCFLLRVKQKIVNNAAAGPEKDRKAPFGTPFCERIAQYFSSST